MERASASLLLPDLDATRAFGARLAASLGPGSVVLLEGDLGAGKSELARAVVQSLAGAAIHVPSPTFTLMQSYALPGLELTHSDLYRLADADEARELGIEECWQRGALLVEWPDRAAELWPSERLVVALEPVAGAGPDARLARLEGTGRWAPLLATLVGRPRSG